MPRPLHVTCVMCNVTRCSAVPGCALVLCGVTVIPHKMPRKKGLIGWVPASGIIIDFFLYNFIHSQNYLQEDTFLKKPRKPQGTLPNPEQHMSGPQVGGCGGSSGGASGA